MARASWRAASTFGSTSTSPCQRFAPADRQECLSLPLGSVERVLAADLPRRRFTDCHGIKYGYDFVGPDRLLYASHHPWVDPNLIVFNIDSLDLPAEDQKKIYTDNAKKLFRL